MRRFSLFKRSNSKYFYAQLKNPETGKYLPARSTGKTDESEALLVVAEWLKHGIPDGSEQCRSLDVISAIDSVINNIRTLDLNTAEVKRIIAILHSRGLLHSAELPILQNNDEKLIPFLKRFWDYDQSPYVREKHAYGQSIGKRHCYEQTKRLHHWKDFFGNESGLQDITRDQLKEFQFYLRDKGLQPKTINMIVAAGTVAFGWMNEQGFLATNPSEGLRKFSGKSKDRGILKPDQVKSLFAQNWPDFRAFVGNLVAMSTGLRSGEILSLRKEDIGSDCIHVRFSWSFADGLKKPKNGEERKAPLLPSVRKELMRLARLNPHGENGFLFFHANPDRPCDGEILRKGLLKALIDMSLSEKDRKNKEKRKTTHNQWIEAGISFHSWRHYYAAHMAEYTEMRVVQLATGHKNTAMAEHYANHADAKHFQGVLQAAKRAFPQLTDSAAS